MDFELRLAWEKDRTQDLRAGTGSGAREGAHGLLCRDFSGFQAIFCLANGSLDFVVAIWERIAKLLTLFRPLGLLQAPG